VASLFIRIIAIKRPGYTCTCYHLERGVKERGERRKGRRREGENKKKAQDGRRLSRALSSPGPVFNLLFEPSS
jgi:hypothetical protein